MEFTKDDSYTLKSQAEIIRRDFNCWNINTAFHSIHQDGYLSEALLLEILEQEAPRQVRLNRRFTIAVVMLCGIALLWIAVGVLVYALSHTPVSGLWWFFVPMALLTATCVLGASYAGSRIPTRVQRRCALCLCLLCNTVEDVHGVGPLLDGIGCWFGDMYKSWWTEAAMFALIRLLPKLQAADSVWVTRKQSGVLETIAGQFWKTKTQYKEIDLDHPLLKFQLAAVFALGQAGQASSLPVLKKLAGMKPSSDTRKAMQGAAAQAAEVLEARLSV